LTKLSLSLFILLSRPPPPHRCAVEEAVARAAEALPRYCAALDRWLQLLNMDIAAEVERVTKAVTTPAQVGC
jgi:hypothetical protein